MGEKAQITSVDGFTLGAYRAEPDGEPKAAVVVIQEIFGVNSHIRDVADGYAAEGYLVIAPQIFDRVDDFDGLFTQFVRRANGMSGIHTAASQKHREAGVVVVTAGLIEVLLALGVRRASEFTPQTTSVSSSRPKANMAVVWTEVSGSSNTGNSSSVPRQSPTRPIAMAAVRRTSGSGFLRLVCNNSASHRRLSSTARICASSSTPWLTTSRGLIWAMATTRMIEALIRRWDMTESSR